MASMTEREIDELLGMPEVGVLATADADGRPEGSPIWFDYVDGKILIHVGGRSRKARNVRANPHVSLTVDTRQVPYRGVVLRGTARVRDRDDELRRNTAVRYLGEDLGKTYLAATEAEAAGSVLIEMTVAGKYSWDYSKGL